MDEPFGPVMDLNTWKTKAQDGDAPTNVVLHKDVDVEIKADEDAETFSFTISTEAPDRDKDVIKAEGWDLGNFLKNPVVMFAHDYKSLPIGKATSVSVEGNKLKSTVEFVPADTPVIGPMADAVSRMLKGGFLNATSVGFRPLTHSFNDERGGFDFEKTELLEYSIVPVPAHPDALQDAKSAGINVDPIVKWANGIIEANSTFGVTKITVEEAPKPVTEPTTHLIDVSPELKSLLEKLNEPPKIDLRSYEDLRGCDDGLSLAVDFDPGEMRLELADPDPEPETDIDLKALETLIKQSFVDGVREKVSEVARDRVNALRGRVD